MAQHTTPPIPDFGDRDIMIRTSEIVVLSKISDGTTNVIMKSGIQINITDSFDQFAKMAMSQIEPTWFVVKLVDGAN